MDYEADIEIDATALDMEWLDQPVHVIKYCKIAAEARQRMDLAKEAVELQRALLDKAVRSDPGTHGIPKITEDAVKGAVQINPDYQKAVRRYIDAKTENDIALGVVKAFEHRKAALENLVRLHGASYFAGPSVPRDLANERQVRKQRDKQASISIGKVMRRRAP